MVKRNKTETWAIFLVIICTLFTSIGQLFFKLGSETATFDLSLLVNYNLIIGLCFYVVAAFFLVKALRGGELSVLYPIIATSFIWVTFLSSFYLNEQITFARWIGVIIIGLGISLIGRGSK